ncbi:IS3 family transposase [Plantactinospora sp. B6F1]|uniref:IS3 family transposase n=1 Tax=Plantactinospora sp. B6F1 TaxID=3158971 RepID=UPI0032D93C60
MARRCRPSLDRATEGVGPAPYTEPTNGRSHRRAGQPANSPGQPTRTDGRPAAAPGRVRTATSKDGTAADLIRRAFTAPAPNVAWCGDITEIVTDDGKLYLATVIDLYSRRILGYAMGAHHDTSLVVAALNMAAVTRGGDVAGVIFHSDRGSEYCSADFARACARWKVRQSMGRVGSCFDNAVAEATFSTLKVEYVHRRRFRTRNEARIKIATWITDFYNNRRRHSVCDGRSPINYERSTVRAQEAQAA